MEVGPPENRSAETPEGESTEKNAQDVDRGIRRVGVPPGDERLMELVEPAENQAEEKQDDKPGACRSSIETGQRIRQTESEACVQHRVEDFIQKGNLEAEADIRSG